MILVVSTPAPKKRRVPLNGLGKLDPIEMLQTFAIGLGVYLIGRAILKGKP